MSNIPEQSKSIEEFVEAGKDSATLSYYNFSILQVESSTDGKVSYEFTSSNLINDYLDIFKEHAQVIELSKDEKHRYYYNPDLLAYDLYGTVDLDFVIMIMNGVIDPKEFNLPTLKLLSKTTLIRLLSQVYNAEASYLRTNREKYNLSMPGE